MAFQRLKERFNEAYYTSPKEPRWSRVLHALYDSENRYHEVAIDWTSLKNSQLEEELDIEGEKLQESIAYLLDVGLIEYAPPEMKPESEEPKELLRLTEKGFNVAHERSIKKGETIGNAAIIYLTSVLALSEALKLLGDAFPKFKWYIGFILALVIILVFHILLKDAKNLGGGPFGMYT